MRILITSGGTKVPIDPVRSITNHSTGKFGADIAKAALQVNMDVIYLTSLEGISPFCESFNCYSINKKDFSTHAFKENVVKLQNLHAFSEKYRKHYTEYRYRNYSEYASLLKKVIENHQPDIVVLAAAVSDYVTENYSSDKIRSHGDLNIKLKTAPKLIHDVKKWKPNVLLIGFKLLLDGTDSELIAAALKSILMHKADLIVANNLRSLEEGRHEIMLVGPNGHFQKIKNNLAESIVNRITHLLADVP